MHPFRVLLAGKPRGQVATENEGARYGVVHAPIAAHGVHEGPVVTLRARVDRPLQRDATSRSDPQSILRETEALRGVQAARVNPEDIVLGHHADAEIVELGKDAGVCRFPGVPGVGEGLATRKIDLIGRLRRLDGVLEHHADELIGGVAQRVGHVHVVGVDGDLPGNLAWTRGPTKRSLGLGFAPLAPGQAHAGAHGDHAFAHPQDDGGVAGVHGHGYLFAPSGCDGG